MEVKPVRRRELGSDRSHERLKGNEPTAILWALC